MGAGDGAGAAIAVDPARPDRARLGLRQAGRYVPGRDRARGQTNYGICSTDFLEYAFRTDSYRLEITFNPDGSWSYVSETMLTVRGRTEPFQHRDVNTLVKVAEAKPNPLMLLQAAKPACVLRARPAVGENIHGRDGKSPCISPWSRPDEIAAPLGILEDRFPALFELRRMFWPRVREIRRSGEIRSGRRRFPRQHPAREFHAVRRPWRRPWTGNPSGRPSAGRMPACAPLDGDFLAGVDTLIVISFDSSRTQQQASDTEIAAIRSFLDHPDHTALRVPASRHRQHWRSARGRGGWRGRSLNSTITAIPASRRGRPSAISGSRF